MALGDYSVEVMAVAFAMVYTDTQKSNHPRKDSLLKNLDEVLERADAEMAIRRIAAEL